MINSLGEKGYSHTLSTRSEAGGMIDTTSFHPFTEVQDEAIGKYLPQLYSTI